MQPVCTFCEDEYGLLMDTDLMEGDTKVIGPSCLIMYSLSLAANVTINISPELAEAYGELFDKIAANDSRRKTVNPPSEPEKQPPDGSVNTSAATQSGDSPASSDTTFPCPECQHPVTDDDGDGIRDCPNCGERFATEIA